MGQTLGRALGAASGLGRSGQDGEDGSGSGSGGSSGAVYRYPPKGGAGAAYFASHFIMGGEKFDSPQPESFLFGENADLNLVGSRPVAFPYPPPQAHEPTKTLRSQINIRKDSLHLSAVKKASAAAVPQGQEEGGGDGSGESPTSAAAAPAVPAPSGPPKYNVRFTFDSDVRCAITLYYFCLEEHHGCGVTYTAKRPDLVSDTYVYQRGAAQTFDQPGHVFRPSKCVKELAGESGAGAAAEGRIPLVIHCVSLEGEAPRQSHSTLAMLELHEDGSGAVSIKNVKQKLFVDGLSYFLQEIYGLENKVPDARPAAMMPDDEEVDDCGSECVVCMCDLRDTIILPCRHLCLCNACADSLRYQANNCPICRAPFRALLQIRAVQKVNQVTHPALADAADVAQEGVPPGYQCVSLVEALNGPPTPPTQSQEVMPLTVALPPEKKSKRSRSGKKRSKPSSSSSCSSGAVASTAPREGSIEEEGAEVASEGAAATPTEVDAKRGDDSTVFATAPNKVSIKIVNEVKGCLDDPAETEGGATTTLIVGSGTNSSSRSSVDVVEEELANMIDNGGEDGDERGQEAQGKEDGRGSKRHKGFAAAETKKSEGSKVEDVVGIDNEEERQEGEKESEPADDAVVVRISSGKKTDDLTRGVIPGTPVKQKLFI